ncbi:hypothetical protein HETIRDRAFT_426125 [Heterobasidion irregulare TC 32-1]|uniref:Uncharacterized protein n=1 Tax=Heterobasidion irregulare (strain TC 32-1) TaxID=747525 RepID=W4KAP8_HETIT|nr:uncharacterized protein HETIRDRAFT_426125 [Heterobasidion irregulare TC 32-1]ETW82440.1 hypothetical protein HETIRDRAFT_426125 [Heterobasidion irregulare TC 32-1]
MWSPDDGTFNYPIFYRRIVELFERTVFGDESGCAIPNSGAQATSLDTGVQISATPLLGLALEASNLTRAALNMLTTMASRMNAPGADDTDHTMMTGSSSPPPLRQLATQSSRHGQSTQSSRHGQSNWHMLLRILDEDKDENKDMYLDGRPCGSLSKSSMHDGEDGTAHQSRKCKTLMDDDSDAANNNTGSIAHHSCKPRCLVEEDDEHKHDNHNHNNHDNHDNIVPQLHKRTAAHAQYDNDSSHTSKARKAKMNAGTMSTSKGKGRS